MNYEAADEKEYQRWVLPIVNLAWMKMVTEQCMSSELVLIPLIENAFYSELMWCKDSIIERTYSKITCEQVNYVIHWCAWSVDVTSINPHVQKSKHIQEVWFFFQERSSVMKLVQHLKHTILWMLANSPYFSWICFVLLDVIRNKKILFPCFTLKRVNTEC
jgi:hypothetical protein